MGWEKTGYTFSSDEGTIGHIRLATIIVGMDSKTATYSFISILMMRYVLV